MHTSLAFDHLQISSIKALARTTDSLVHDLGSEQEDTYRIPAKFCHVMDVKWPFL
jgi:hypothetical protein